MIGSPQAVFLSYASEDAAAARRICEALRSAGIEVWFDQSELRGGDAWDASIRRQIKACALFVPVISANAHAREEGYFRLEWKLAVDRSHLMADTRAFLLPVVIDATSQPMSGCRSGSASCSGHGCLTGSRRAAFIQHVQRLLSAGDGGAAPHSSHAPLPAAAVSPAVSAPPQSGAPHVTATAGTPARMGSAPWWYRLAMLLIVAVVVIAIGYTVIDRLIPERRGNRGGGDAGPATQVAEPAATSKAEKSIAVLPFVDMSEKHDQEYFSDGLTEELIDRLARNPGTSGDRAHVVVLLQGQAGGSPTIASRLRVAHLLEGSVRKAGHTMRVTAQLIRANDGVHLWSETYDRDFKDVFKVQDEIAAAVVKALQVKLLSTPVDARSGPRNTDAYSLYLQGQYFARRASNVDVERGIATSSRPSRWRRTSHQRTPSWLAPTCTSPPSGVARRRASTAPARRWMGPFASIQPSQLAHNVRALSPSSFGIGLLRGRSSMRRSRPRHATPRHCFDVGNSRARSAIRTRHWSIIVRASSSTRCGSFTTFNWRCCWTACGARTKRVPPPRPQSPSVRPCPKRTCCSGCLNSTQGTSTPRALRWSANPPSTTGSKARQSWHSQISAWRSRMRRSSRLIEAHHDTAAVQIAQAYAYRGERAKAFDWLDRAVVQRDPGLINLKTDPLFAGLRGDARYKTVLRKMNLPES